MSSHCSQGLPPLGCSAPRLCAPPGGRAGGYCTMITLHKKVGQVICTGQSVKEGHMCLMVLITEHVSQPSPTWSSWCHTWAASSTRRWGPAGCWMVSHSRNGAATRGGGCSAQLQEPGRCPGWGVSPAAPGWCLPQGAGSSAPCSSRSHRAHR